MKRDVWPAAQARHRPDARCWRGHDDRFSPLESSLEVFGIDIDAVPGGHLVALSRAGQTFRASVTPSLREVGIWGMSALRLGKPAYFEGPSVSHGND